MDRNPSSATVAINLSESLSARRAWIEILIALPETLNFTVALRKESVDRNYGSDLTYSDGVGRSPQGERG